MIHLELTLNAATPITSGEKGCKRNPSANGIPARRGSTQNSCTTLMPVTPDLERYCLGICSYSGHPGNLAQMSAQVEPGG
ncbi:MAG: hypothetical protein WB678_00535 [Stellaceae bacterium]|jgi:hypothetical protein